MPVDQYHGIKPGIVKSFQNFGKGSEFMKFISNIPAGLPTNKVASVFNSLSASTLRKLIPLCSSITSPSKITIEMCTTEPLNVLFNIDTKGIGKGEVMCAFVLKNAKISGGSESYDMLIGNQKFELKEYLGGGKMPIRLGVEGRVSRFDFWKEIQKTLDKVDKYKQTLKRVPELKDSVNYILNRMNTISSGELNRKDKIAFNKLYEALSHYVGSTGNPEDDYTQATFRGPKVKPATFPIKTIDADSVQEKDVIKIEKVGSNKGADDEAIQGGAIVVDLARIKYVRSPKALDADIQKVIKYIVGDTTFMVFRPDKIRITNDFRYVTISQAGIKIIEADLVNQVKEEPEE